MLETPHVAVAIAVATKIPNPLISFPLILGSHFILDMTPHWNPHTYTETQKLGRPSNKTFAVAVFDISLALFIGLFFAYLALPDTNSALYIIAACFLSVLPDVIKYPFFLFKSLRKGLLKKYVEFERSLQESTSFIPGILIQIIIVLASIWWIYN